MATGAQPKNKMKRGMRFAKRTNTSTKLSKRIGWLNKNAGLSQEIIYSEVKELLTDVGDRDAMRLLGELEDKDKTVRDPTAYLRAAALRILEGGSGSGDGGGPKARGNDMPLDEDVLMQKIEKRVQWLNGNANLRQDLSMDEVANALVGAGRSQAMQVLKDLEENADEVLDPNTYVLELLNNSVGEPGGPADDDRPGPDGGEGVDGEPGRGRSRRRRGGAKRAAREPVGRNVIKTGLKDKSGGAFVDQVRRRVDWLNKHAGLSQDLDFDRVGDLLLRMGQQKEAMKLLKQLEDNAAEVRDPSAYVASAARKLLREQEKVEKADRPGNRSSRADPKLSRHIGWMNKNVPLTNPIEFDRVAHFLQDIDPQQAMAILHDVEDNATEVRDPSAYIIAAARRLGEEPKSAPMPPPPPPARRPEAYAPTHALPAPTPGAGAAEAKLQKRIAWLNSHITLNSPLIFERVAPELLSVDTLTALEVLNMLEENSEMVRDPNAWVVARARRQGPGGGGGGPPGLAQQEPQPGSFRQRLRSGETSMPPARAPLGDPGMEERLVKRVTWLNRNVCPSSPLDLDQVVSALLPLAHGQAMDVLKKFEDSAHEVRNPSAFVIAAARRSANGETRGDGRGPIGTAPPPSSRPSSRGGGGSVAGSRPSSAGSAGRTGGVASRGSSRSAPMMALPGAPAMDEKITYYGGAEEKLRKRIDWLNMNVPMTSPLASDRVVPELLKVPPREAMDMLKRLEEGAHDVREPTGFVISMARRATGASSARGPRRRRRGDDDEVSI